MPIDLLAQALLSGFALALVYVLVALGLTLIFSIFEIINFAHGEFYMLGGYVTYFGFVVFGLPYFLTLVLAIVVVGLAGLVAERLIFRHLRGKTLNAFLQWTRLGRAMRAVAQDPDGAALQGVNIEGISMVGFAIGCALAGSAGGLLAPVLSVSPTMGALPVIKAFIMIIVGGMGSLPGAVLGGLLLGMVEGIGSLFFGSAAVNLLGFLMVIAVLLVRPRGLFGAA